MPAYSKRSSARTGKPSESHRRVSNALAIDLVFTGAQHRDKLHRRIVFFSTANEFVFPSRLAFDIENAPLRVAHKERARHRVVGQIFFAGERYEKVRLFAPASPAGKKNGSV